MPDQPTSAKIADIEVDPNHNPREDFAKKPIEELAASIKMNGIGQPLLVTTGSKPGKVKLVDGERRLRAAKMANLKEVPVYFREDAEDKALGLALTMNMLRESLDPIEQANGFAQMQADEGLNQKEVAARVGVSQSVVSQRLLLLKLPEETQGLVARGQVALDEAPRLAKVAAISPSLADHLAGVIADEGELRWPGLFVGYEGCALVTNFGRLTARELENLVEPDVIDEFKLAFGNNDYDGMYWDEDDVDAARQYGCLVEIHVEHHSPRGTDLKVLTDPEFVLGRIQHHIEAQAKKIKEDTAGRKADPQTGAPAKSESQAEADRKAREKELNERAKAHAFNVEIGSKMREAFYAPEITLDRMKLIAIMIVEGNDYRHLAAASIAFTDETIIEVKERGGIKVLGSKPAREQLIAHINVAKTPQEIMGILLYAIVGSQIANHESVPPSGRPVFTLPGEYGKAKPSVKLALEQALDVFKSGSNTGKSIKARLDRMKGIDEDD